MEHILAIEQQQQNKVTTAAERATSRHAPVLLWSRIGGRWCWWRISSALPMCSYSRTPVERPPSPATIPLIRPYFVWRTVFSVCTIPDQRPSLWRDQRPGQMEFTPSRTTTSRIPERLWNECPIEGSIFYIEFQQAAVLNEHKKIAYRAQEWLMTRPANIVDSERLNEHGWTKA